MSGVCLPSFEVRLGAPAAAVADALAQADAACATWLRVPITAVEWRTATSDPAAISCAMVANPRGEATSIFVLGVSVGVALALSIWTVLRLVARIIRGGDRNARAGGA